MPSGLPAWMQGAVTSNPSPSTDQLLQDHGAARGDSAPDPAPPPADTLPGWGLSSFGQQPSPDDQTAGQARIDAAASQYGQDYVDAPSGSPRAQLEAGRQGSDAYSTLTEPRRLLQAGSVALQGGAAMFAGLPGIGSMAAQGAAQDLGLPGPIPDILGMAAFNVGGEANVAQRVARTLGQGLGVFAGTQGAQQLSEAGIPGVSDVAGVNIPGFGNLGGVAGMFAGGVAADAAGNYRPGEGTLNAAEDLGRAVRGETPLYRGAPAGTTIVDAEAERATTAARDLGLSPEAQNRLAPSMATTPTGYEAGNVTPEELAFGRGFTPGATPGHTIDMTFGALDKALKGETIESPMPTASGAPAEFIKKLSLAELVRDYPGYSNDKPKWLLTREDGTPVNYASPMGEDDLRRLFSTYRTNVNPLEPIDPRMASEAARINRLSTDEVRQRYVEASNTYLDTKNPGRISDVTQFGQELYRRTSGAEGIRPTSSTDATTGKITYTGAQPDLAKPTTTKIGLKTRFSPTQDGFTPAYPNTHVGDIEAWGASSFKQGSITLQASVVPNRGGNTYELSMVRQGKSILSTNREPDGSDLKSLLGIRSVISDLVKQNPDAIFIAHPNDVRRADIYTKTGFRPLMNGDLPEDTGGKGSSSWIYQPGNGYLVLDRAKFKLDTNLTTGPTSISTTAATPPNGNPNIDYSKLTPVNDLPTNKAYGGTHGWVDPNGQVWALTDSAAYHMDSLKEKSITAFRQMFTDGWVRLVKSATQLNVDGQNLNGVTRAIDHYLAHADNPPKFITVSTSTEGGTGIGYPSGTFSTREWLEGKPRVKGDQITLTAGPGEGQVFYGQGNGEPPSLSDAMARGASNDVKSRFLQSKGIDTSGMKQRDLNAALRTHRDSINDLLKGNTPPPPEGQPQLPDLLNGTTAPDLASARSAAQTSQAAILDAVVAARKSITEATPLRNAATLAQRAEAGRRIGSFHDVRDAYLDEVHATDYLSATPDQRREADTAATEQLRGGNPVELAMQPLAPPHADALRTYIEQWRKSAPGVQSWDAYNARKAIDQLEIGIAPQAGRMRLLGRIFPGLSDSLDIHEGVKATADLIENVIRSSPLDLGTDLQHSTNPEVLAAGIKAKLQKALEAKAKQDAKPKGEGVPTTEDKAAEELELPKAVRTRLPKEMPSDEVLLNAVKRVLAGTDTQGPRVVTGVTADGKGTLEMRDDIDPSKPAQGLSGPKVEFPSDLHASQSGLGGELGNLNLSQLQSQMLANADPNINPDAGTNGAPLRGTSPGTNIGMGPEWKPGSNSILDGFTSASARALYEFTSAMRHVAFMAHPTLGALQLWQVMGRPMTILSGLGARLPDEAEFYAKYNNALKNGSSEEDAFKLASKGKEHIGVIMTAMRAVRGALTDDPNYKAETARQIASEFAYTGLTRGIADSYGKELGTDADGNSIFGPAGKLTNREEMLGRSLLERIPYVGRIFTASSEMLAASVTDVRNNLMDQWLRLHRQQYGQLPSQQLADNMATRINWMTGRGSLGPLENRMGDLSTALTSPRLFAGQAESFAQYFDPSFLREPSVRNYIASTQARSILMWATLAGITAATGLFAPLNLTDPESGADFGKLVSLDGKLHLDFGGGYLQHIRALSGIFSGTKNASSPADVLHALTDPIARELENHLSPAADLAREVVRGKTALGDPLSWDEESVKKVAEEHAPLLAQQLYGVFTQLTDPEKLISLGSTVTARQQIYTTPSQDMNRAEQDAKTAATTSGQLSKYTPDFDASKPADTWGLLPGERSILKRQVLKDAPQVALRSAQTRRDQSDPIQLGEDAILQNVATAAPTYKGLYDDLLSGAKTPKDVRDQLATERSNEASFARGIRSDPDYARAVSTISSPNTAKVEDDYYKIFADVQGPDANRKLSADDWDKVDKGQQDYLASLRDRDPEMADRLQHVIDNTNSQVNAAPIVKLKREVDTSLYDYYQIPVQSGDNARKDYLAAHPELDLGHWMVYGDTLQSVAAVDMALAKHGSDALPETLVALTQSKQPVRLEGLTKPINDDTSLWKHDEAGIQEYLNLPKLDKQGKPLSLVPYKEKYPDIDGSLAYWGAETHVESSAAAFALDQRISRLQWPGWTGRTRDNVLRAVLATSQQLETARTSNVNNVDADMAAFNNFLYHKPAEFYSADGRKEFSRMTGTPVAALPPVLDRDKVAR